MVVCLVLETTSLVGTRLVCRDSLVTQATDIFEILEYYGTVEMGLKGSLHGDRWIRWCDKVKKKKTVVCGHRSGPICQKPVSMFLHDRLCRETIVYDNCQGCSFRH